MYELFRWEILDNGFGKKKKPKQNKTNKTKTLCSLKNKRNLLKGIPPQSNEKSSEKRHSY
jgi:hypothetical protein